MDLINERRALHQLEAAFSQKSQQLQALNRVGSPSPPSATSTSCST